MNGTIDTRGALADLGIATPPPVAARKEELGGDAFLKLMTVQLQNQDPLKPLESNAFLSQLAQFSSVQGIQQLNEGFTALAASIESERRLQGASLIGHDVLVAGNRFLADGGGIAGDLDVPYAGEVTVEISDAGGAVVRRLRSGADLPGEYPFAWDGRLEDGSVAPRGEYTVQARLAAGGRTEALPTSLIARVNSVTLSPDGPVLDLAGIGGVPLSGIRRIG